jgi:uncharacterized metal-binding protein YceD (DUF177 family)
MSGWRDQVRLAEVARAPLNLTWAPDEARRAAIAKSLGLESLPALTATLAVRPWLDGAEIEGRFSARVEQICGVSLDPFQQDLAGDIEVRVVPAGSPNAPEDPEAETVVDAEAPDPPDVLEGEVIDLAAYVIEHLALEIDPFPRKPGVAFDFDPGTPDDSPFAALKALKDRPK